MERPALAALNPQAALPDRKILARYQSQAAGDNEMLSAYLLKEDHAQFKAYLSAIGVPTSSEPSAFWPKPKSGQNPSGYPAWAKSQMTHERTSADTAQSVAQTAGAIAYVPSPYGKSADRTTASVVNARGIAVAPSTSNVTMALGNATLNSDLSENLSLVFADTAPNAYPLSAYSYLVAPCDPVLAHKHATTCSGGSGPSSFPTAKGAELGAFVNYIVCLGQAQVDDFGYAAVPPILIENAFIAIGSIAGATEPPPPTPAGCPNPTLVAG